MKFSQLILGGLAATAASVAFSISSVPIVAVSSASAASAASAAAATTATTAASAAAQLGIFASIGAFIVGIVGGAGMLGLAALILLGILFEHNDRRGWSVFLALLTIGAVYILFQVPLMTLGLYAIGYFLIGVVWSFWRYKRHAAKVVEQYKDRSSSDRQFALTRLHPKAMLPTITAWVMIWPFSFVENMLSDVITLVQDAISKLFRGIYHRIYNSAVASLSDSTE